MMNVSCSIRRLATVVAGIGIAACAGPPPPMPEVPSPPPLLPSMVWTLEGEAVLRDGPRRVAIQHPFTRLDVLGFDEEEGLRVRCTVCAPAVEGSVSRDAIALPNGAPGGREEGSLAEFLAAVRAAAADRDLVALRSVMSPWFTYSLDEMHGPVAAVRRWRSEGFRRLDRLPEILDEGVATRDGSLWIAPARFLDDPDYRGVRAGFEREDGRWRWLFLVGEPSG